MHARGPSPAPHHLLLSNPMLYLTTLPVEVVQLLALYQSVVSPWRQLLQLTVAGLNGGLKRMEAYYLSLVVFPEAFSAAECNKIREKYGNEAGGWS